MGSNGISCVHSAVVAQLLNIACYVAGEHAASGNDTSEDIPPSAKMVSQIHQALGSWLSMKPLQREDTGANRAVHD